MDSGAIPKAAPVAPAATVRSDLVPARPAAATEVAPEKVVQPVGESPAVVFDTSPHGGQVADVLAAVDRQVALEEGTRNVVVSWVDPDSGDVVDQFPTEQTLKLRAYWREQARESTNRDVADKGAIVI